MIQVRLGTVISVRVRFSINQAIEKYGKENFDHRVIAQFATRDLAFEAEIVYIARCIDDPMCYNVAPGGVRGFDWNTSFEVWRKRDPNAYYAHMHSTSARNSKSMKEVWEDSELRKRQSETCKKTWEDPELRKCRSETMKEVWKNPELRKRCSEIMKKVTADPKVRKNMSNVMKEKWKDPEFRERRSRSMADPKVRKNMSNAMKEKWADPKYREKVEKLRRSKPLTEKELEGYLKQCRSGISRVSKLKPTSARMKDLENRRLRERHLLKQIAEYQTNDQ